MSMARCSAVDHPGRRIGGLETRVFDERIDTGDEMGRIVSDGLEADRDPGNAGG